jgi:hypothetical protein
MPESSQNNRPELTLLEELTNFFTHHFGVPYEELTLRQKGHLTYFIEFMKGYSFIRNLEGQKRVWEEFEKYTFVSEAPKVRAQKEITKLSEEITKETNKLIVYREEEILMT